MNTVTEHYRRLLARHYTWLMGGMEGKLREMEALFRGLKLRPEGNGLALDLGSGPGYQSLALAGAGFSVTAVDTSEELLAELEKAGGDLPIQRVCADMCGYLAGREEAVELVVCMGDTLPHLASRQAVEALLQDTYRLLAPGGRLLLQYRDLSHELKGEERFIPVRSDEKTIFTCFLEYGPETVAVHDLVHGWDGERWSFAASSYHKLRLARAWVAEALSRAGFVLERDDMDRGMVLQTARRA